MTEPRDGLAADSGHGRQDDLKELVQLARSLRIRLMESSRKGASAGFVLSASHLSERAAGAVAEEDCPGAPSLEDLRRELGECRRCALHETRRTIVFGEGNPRASLLFVGEAPGAEEDRHGLPFVGRAGALLTRIIEAMGLKREDVYICNILKCRPPGNRNPEAGEIQACEPFLKAQIQAIRPRVICTLGSFAARSLLKKDAPISVLRGNFHEYRDIPLMPTYHPAYLLRNPGAKRQVWEDMQMVMEFLGRQATSTGENTDSFCGPAGCQTETAEKDSEVL